MIALLRRAGWAVSSLLLAMLKTIRSLDYSYRYLLITLFVTGIAILIEYSYLNRLYLLDDIYDITGPRELSLDEKFTIKTIANHDNLQLLKTFVEFHCLCESVHEIHILWSLSSDPPDPQAFFIYSHAHAIVFFEKSENNNLHNLAFHPSRLNTSTEAVLYLDVDTQIRCDDLAFMHSVWRSSPDSAGIGTFPRFVTADSSGDLLYYGPYNVWLHAKYHIVLQAALMQHKRFIHVIMHSTWIFIDCIM